MARLTPRFSANRTVREYTEQHYLPAAAAYQARAANKGGGRQADGRLAARPGREMGRAALRRSEGGGRAAGSTSLKCRSVLNDLDPEAVRVELYADGQLAALPSGRRWSWPAHARADRWGRPIARSVPADRPATDYAARAIPQYPDVATPLEVNAVLWQH